MQSVTPPPYARNVALQHGVIFGLAQTVIAVSILLLNTFVTTTVGLALLLATMNFLLSLAAYFGAGTLAARQTGWLSTGTFAGLWAGASYGVLNFIVSLIIFLQVALPRALAIIGNSAAFLSNPDAARVGAIIGGVGIEILGFLLAIGLGAGMGALGGLAGRRRSPLRPPPVTLTHAPSPYTPHPGQMPLSPLSARPNADQPGDQPYMEQPH
jgi:hypothetical protein